MIKILGKNCLEVNTNAVTDRQGKFVYDMITIKYENALATIEIGTTVDVEDEVEYRLFRGEYFRSGIPETL